MVVMRWFWDKGRGFLLFVLVLALWLFATSSTSSGSVYSWTMGRKKRRGLHFKSECWPRLLPTPTLMQDQRIILPEEIPNGKPQKKKPLSQMANPILMKKAPAGSKEASHLSGKSQKGTKRVLKSEASPPFQQTDKSTPDPLLDPPGSSDEYRALRRKYLLLEEESFAVDRELSEVDAEVRTLEAEKLALLDQLVVLEGLVDPSEIKHEGGPGKEAT